MLAKKYQNIVKPVIEYKTKIFLANKSIPFMNIILIWNITTIKMKQKVGGRTSCLKIRVNVRIRSNLTKKHIGLKEDKIL